MIPFFVGYAMLVWYLSAKYRRSVLAFACVLTGVALLAVLSYGHWMIGKVHPELMIQGMQILMYPYTAAVGLVGLFISSLPHRHPEGCCHACGYNMAGLPRQDHPSRTASCPECGSVGVLIPVHYRRSGVERTDLRAGDLGVSATDAAVGAAGEEDHSRQQTEQGPPHG